MTPEERLKEDIELINKFVDEDILDLHGNELRADILYFIRRLARNIEYRNNMICHRRCCFRKGDLEAPDLIIW